MRNAKISVHAGSGWEGHIVFTVSDPEQPEKRHLSSNLEEVASFCKKNDLLLSEEFIRLVKQCLVYETKTGFVIPHKHINERTPVSSAHAFLRKYFSEYT